MTLLVYFIRISIDQSNMVCSVIITSWTAVYCPLNISAKPCFDNTTIDSQLHTVCTRNYLSITICNQEVYRELISTDLYICYKLNKQSKPSIGIVLPAVYKHKLFQEILLKRLEDPHNNAYPNDHTWLRPQQSCIE